jgi:hypothetical protein
MKKSITIAFGLILLSMATVSGKTPKSTPVKNQSSFIKTVTAFERLNIELKYTASGIDRSADGAVALYGSSFSNAVDGDDAQQMANWDEDICLLRSGVELSIECRTSIELYDTLFLKVARLKPSQGSYRWELKPVNFFEPGMQTFLMDNFTNTSTAICLTTPTVINFLVTADPASTASNRFKITFRNSSSLPVQFNYFNVYAKNNLMKIDWGTIEEININRYEVESSIDGLSFSTVASVVANAKIGVNNYSVTDVNQLSGTRYYRIKVNELNGSFSYSEVNKVTINNTDVGAITVYPNPVLNNLINIQFANLEKGKYTISISNYIGQIVYQQQIEYAGGKGFQRINIDKPIAIGNYQLTVSDANTIKCTSKILKQ